VEALARVEHVLLVKRAVQIFEGPEVRQGAAAGQKTDARARVGAVVEGDLQHLQDVQEGHAGHTVAPFARHPHFDASNDGVIVRVLGRHPLLQQRRDDHFVVLHRGHAEAQLDRASTFQQEAIRRAGVHPGRDIGLGQAHVLDRLEHHVGQLVRGICAVRRLPADGHILIGRVPDAEAGVIPGPDLDDGEKLKPQQFQQFLRLRLRQPARSQISPVEGVKILIEPPEREGVAVALDLAAQVHEIGGLDSLGEGARGLARHPAAPLGDGHQLGPALGRCLGQVGLAHGLVREPAGEPDHGLQSDDRALQEGTPLESRSLVGRKRIAGSLGLGNHALEAHLHNLADVQDDVPIARSDHAAAGDDAHLRAGCNVRGHDRISPVVERLALPCGHDPLQDGCAHPLGNAVTVRGPLVELIDLCGQEIHQVLGEERRGPRRTCLVAHHQLILVDVDRHAVEGVGKRPGAAQHRRIGSVALVGLGHQEPALDADARLAVQHPLTKFFHARRASSDRQIASDRPSGLFSGCLHHPHSSCPSAGATPLRTPFWR